MKEEELKEGCGKEACAVMTRTDDGANDEPDITECGVMCPYHKVVHYCLECQKKLNLIQEGKEQAKQDEIEFLEELRKHERDDDFDYLIFQRLAKLKEKK